MQYPHCYREWGTTTINHVSVFAEKITLCLPSCELYGSLWLDHLNILHNGLLNFTSASYLLKRINMKMPNILSIHCEKSTYSFAFSFYYGHITVFENLILKFYNWFCSSTYSREYYAFEFSIIWLFPSFFNYWFCWHLIIEIPLLLFLTFFVIHRKFPMSQVFSTRTFKCSRTPELFDTPNNHKRTQKLN